MKEPTYRQAISHAWHIAIRHPLLWIFGFFTAFLGQLGLVDYVVQMSFASSNFAWEPTVLQVKDIVLGFLNIVKDYNFSGLQLLWLLWIVIFFVGIGALLVFISVSSQGALIHGVTQSIGVFKKKQINLGKAWHAGTNHFWRLLAINFLKKIIVLALVMSIGLSLYSAVTSGLKTGELTIYFLLYLLASVVAATVSLLAVYAAGYVVVEEYSFSEAIHEAWYLFREHWLVSLEIAAIVIIANVFAHIAVLLLGILLLLQMAVLWAVALTVSSVVLWIGFIFFGGFILIMGVAFIGTLLSVFSTTIWTYLFVKMHHKGIKSRILHALGA